VRFSLSTLILVVILAGSLMGIWMRREPWISDESMQADEIAKLLSKEYIYRATGHAFLFIDSADKRSVSIRSLGPERSELAIIADGHRLATIRLDAAQVRTYAFVDDATLVVTSRVPFRHVYEDSEDWGVNLQHYLFRRRFPEYWWGHFYRFEVWTGMLSAVALAAIATRNIFALRKTAA